MSKHHDAMEWLTPEIREHILLAAYEFHVRAFGEELARVNFLPLVERRKYVAAMIDHAQRKGVGSGNRGPNPARD